MRIDHRWAARFLFNDYCMNKSLTTNLLAAAICVIGLTLPETPLKSYALHAGLFALSGAVTNWIAVQMLFEKIPGLYGSGVIVDRFEQFKSGIQTLVLENFFTEDNFKMFTDAALHEGIKPESIHEMIDLDSVFNGFLGAIEASKFGSMLSFVGGLKALEPLRGPFKIEFEKKIDEVIENLDLTKGEMSFDSFRPTVEKLVQGKLDQLNPQEVKLIIERMIREHLGWLVVWGGVFGGLIGILSVFILN